MSLDYLSFFVLIDLIGMLKHFNRMKAAIPKKRLLMTNAEDEMLHKLKEEMFELFYSHNVNTIDVQVVIR